MCCLPGVGWRICYCVWPYLRDFVNVCGCFVAEHDGVEASSVTGEAIASLVTKVKPTALGRQGRPGRRWRLRGRPRDLQ